MARAHDGATNSRPAQPPVIRRTPLNEGGVGTSWLRILPAWLFSFVFHAVILCIFLFVAYLGGLLGDKEAQGSQMEEIIESKVEEAPKDADLTIPDVGIDQTAGETNYNLDRIAEVSVPGPVNPTEVVGLTNAPEGPAQTIPPPPGVGMGTGGGVDMLNKPGNAKPFGLPGGMGGLLNTPGGFGARLASGATREKMIMEGGGSKESEAAVGRALEWLALHQHPSGAWALESYPTCGRTAFGPTGRLLGNCGCRGTGQKNDTAGTAFGLLPFLAAGQTHKPSTGHRMNRDYTKVVENGLRRLILKQDPRTGDLGGGMYAQGLATIALCEAYGLTADPALKIPAQKALNYIVYAQHDGGGWRYSPKQAGDTSVTGWEVMALKSGQMAGLYVPRPTLDGVTRYLDSVMDQSYGYGYAGKGPTPTMSAVGLLCRQYLGWSPRKHELREGVKAHLRTHMPTEGFRSLYYYYYATQVMHHMGGDDWVAWNEKMRDLLIKTQDQGQDPRHAHQRGSWDPSRDGHGGAGGRIMTTALACLTLEVYYRHLPLYRREMGTTKPEEK